MKRQDATEPPQIPSADDPIPELTAWLRAQGADRHTHLTTRIQPHFSAKPPTLYLDTTIVSDIDGLWTRGYLHRHVCFVSDVETLPPSEIGPRLATLHANDRTRELATRILAECGLPEREYDDAHHAAVAAIHDIDVLLTWNCVHLANENMIPRIGHACEAYGCRMPVILTPEQLIGLMKTGR
jgi:hypothetical protein